MWWLKTYLPWATWVQQTDKSPRLESTKGLGPSRLNHVLLKPCPVRATSLIFCGHYVFWCTCKICSCHTRSRNCSSISVWNHPSLFPPKSSNHWTEAEGPGYLLAGASISRTNWRSFALLNLHLRWTLHLLYDIIVSRERVFLNGWAEAIHSPCGTSQGRWWIAASHNNLGSPCSEEWDLEGFVFWTPFSQESAISCW